MLTEQSAAAALAYQPFSPCDCDCADCALLRQALPEHDWSAWLYSVRCAMRPIDPPPPAPPMLSQEMDVEQEGDDGGEEEEDPMQCVVQYIKEPVVMAHNLRPRYMGSLQKRFAQWELQRMNKRINNQVSALVRLATKGRIATAQVGMDRDFVLSVQCGQRDWDGIPTLNVIQLAWTPYLETGRYWKTTGRATSLPILLALERAANYARRRVRLVAVHSDRLRQYFMRMRGYQTQSNDPLTLIDK